MDSQYEGFAEMTDKSLVSRKHYNQTDGTQYEGQMKLVKMAHDQEIWMKQGKGGQVWPDGA